MGTEGENCPALIRCKKNSDRRSFRRRSGRSKALLAESGREGRWYRRALISFTDECEMTSSVVWTHTRRHYTLLYPDPPFLSHSSPARRQLQAKKKTPLQLCANNTSVRYCFVSLLATLSAFTYTDIKNIKKPDFFFIALIALCRCSGLLLIACLQELEIVTLKEH